MTVKELWAWRGRMNWFQSDAAHQLGIGLRTFKTYESGDRPVPHALALAMWALEHGPAYLRRPDRVRVREAAE